MLIRTRTRPLTRDEHARARQLYAAYLARPRHRDRLTPALRAALWAGAVSVAMHGNPPTPRQRLGYRTQKRNRARRAAIAAYGDPLAPGA